MSELRADTITASNGTGPVTLTKQQAVKHWVNYDSVNQTTDGSFNQSTLTDNAEGDFTSNYTNNISSAADKCILTNSWNTRDDGGSDNSGQSRGGSVTSQAGDSANATTNINFHTFFGSNAANDGAFEDMSGSYCMTLGDLA